MMEGAFRLSEEKKLPVLMRITTRMAHSRAAVTVKQNFWRLPEPDVLLFLQTGYCYRVMHVVGIWR